MRQPDLEYMLLNSFEYLRQEDFFIAQELLQGKSICELCLNAPKYVIEATEKLSKDKYRPKCCDPRKGKRLL
jgi:hypothetical protein